MATADELLSHVDKLAATLDTNYIASSQRGKGWGQFLDGPRPVAQVGLYGTSSGVLVLSLAGRAAGANTRSALETLRAWWDDAYGKDKVAEVPRLAFLVLALAKCNNQESSKLLELAREKLLSCKLPSGEWGNWWRSDVENDNTPSLLATALALIALSIQPASPAALGPAAAWLERQLAADAIRTPAEQALALAAIFRAATPSKKTKKFAKRLARANASLTDVVDQFFYDHNRQGEWRRDYVLLPRLPVFAVAGYSRGAPTAMRLQADAISAKLIADFDAKAGAYRPLNESRISTVNQAWAALALHDASVAANQKVGRLATLLYALQRQRRESWLTTGVYPLAVAIVTAALNTLPRPEDAWLLKVAIAVLTTVLGGVASATAVRKLFPGGV